METDPTIMAAVVVIEDASKFRRQEKESDIEFLQRVADKVKRWPDERWRELGDDVQKIINSSSKKKDKKSSEEESVVREPGIKRKPLTKDRGIKRHIKMLLLRDPSLSTERVYDIIIRQHPDVSIHTVRSIRVGFIHTLKTFLRHGGILTPEWEKRVAAIGFSGRKTRSKI